MIDHFFRQLIYPTHNPLYKLDTQRFCPERLRRDAQLIIALSVGAATAWWLIEAVFLGALGSNLYVTVLVTLFLSSLAVMLAADVIYMLEAVNVACMKTAHGTYDLLQLPHLTLHQIASEKRRMRLPRGEP